MSVAPTPFKVITMRMRLDKAVSELEAVRMWALENAMDATNDVQVRMAFGNKAHRIRDLQHRIRTTSAELAAEVGA